MHNFLVFFALALCIFWNSDLFFNSKEMQTLPHSVCVCVCKVANFSACINEVRLSCCFLCNTPHSAGLRGQVCTATVRLWGRKQAHNDFYQAEYQQRHLPPL